MVMVMFPTHGSCFFPHGNCHMEFGTADLQLAKCKPSSYRLASRNIPINWFEFLRMKMFCHVFPFHPLNMFESWISFKKKVMQFWLTILKNSSKPTWPWEVPSFSNRKWHLQPPVNPTLETTTRNPRNHPASSWSLRMHLAPLAVLEV